jgi:hypothetical protein
VILLLSNSQQHSGLSWEYHGENDFSFIWTISSPTIQNNHRISLNIKFTRVPYPSYSPDIASNDFYRFATFRQRLCRCQRKSLEEFQ